MKFIILFLIAGVLCIRYTNAHEDKPRPKMECVKIKQSAPGWLQRCENNEVVCYIYNGESVQCKFKGE